jgi:hypothetical protein
LRRFFRGDNFLVHVSDFVVKTFDVLFQRIILWNRRSRFCHIASQKQNSVHQRAFNSNARPVLLRVADFGTDLGLSLSIDGIPITTLSRGEGYVRDRYSLSVWEGEFTHLRVTFRPGETYAVTAMWEVETIRLETSDLAHIRYPLAW